MTKTLESTTRLIKRPRERHISRTLTADQHDRLSRLVRETRLAKGYKGWSRSRLARSATAHLERLPAAELELRGMPVGVKVSTRYVETLEGRRFESAMLTNERRARLLGVVLALELDRELVNRIAGGI